MAIKRSLVKFLAVLLSYVDSGQVVHTRSESSSSTGWYWSKSGNAMWQGR